MSYQQELAQETEQVIKAVASDLIDRIGEPFVLGHAFLWVTYKAGKKSYRMIAGYGACGNWVDIYDALKKACPQITGYHINLD